MGVRIEEWPLLKQRNSPCRVCMVLIRVNSAWSGPPRHPLLLSMPLADSQPRSWCIFMFPEQFTIWIFLRFVFHWNRMQQLYKVGRYSIFLSSLRNDPRVSICNNSLHWWILIFVVYDRFIQSVRPALSHLFIGISYGAAEGLIWSINRVDTIEYSYARFHTIFSCF